MRNSQVRLPMNNPPRARMNEPQTNITFLPSSIVSFPLETEMMRRITDNTPNNGLQKKQTKRANTRENYMKTTSVKLVGRGGGAIWNRFMEALFTINYLSKLFLSYVKKMPPKPAVII